MIGTDLVLGFLFAKLFENKPNAATPPSAPATRPPPQRPPGPTAPPSAQAPAQAPAAPPPTTAAPAPAAPAPTSPAFPQDVQVPPPTSSTKPFKKGVEVWQVRPELQALKGSPFVVGLVGDVNDATALAALEKNFPTGWRPATKVTEAERNMAVALLAKWVEGNVLFLGPGTLAGRRAFRMTKHPASAVPPTAQPAAAPPVAPPASVAVPAPVAPPVAQSSPGLPQLPAASPPPFVPSTPPAGNVQQATTVRKNEGLAQVGKRLGQPESQATATALRTANLPTGPGGVAYTKLNLSEGGLRQSSRSKGGLQPGDPLFVPTAWGFIDPSRL